MQEELHQDCQLENMLSFQHGFQDHHPEISQMHLLWDQLPLLPGNFLLHLSELHHIIVFILFSFR